MKQFVPASRPLRPVARTLPSFVLAAAALHGCTDPAGSVVRPGPTAPVFAASIAAVPYAYTLLGNIGVPTDTEFFAWAINDSGTIAGQGRDVGGNLVAWRWRSGVFKTTDPTLPLGAGFGMNNRGEVFGVRHDGVNVTALAWHFVTPNAWIEGSYPNLTAGRSTVGYDINDHGDAAGYECTASPCSARAIRWTAALANYPYAPVASALGPLGRDDQAYAMNNVGTIVGWTMLSGRRRAWINTLGGPMKALQVGTTYSDSWPGDVNDADLVVGAARTIALPIRTRFVTWQGLGKPSELAIVQDAPPNLLQRAPARISNAGRIAANDAAGVPFTFYAGVRLNLPLPPGATGVVGAINTCGDMAGRVRYGSLGSLLIRWRRVSPNGLPYCDGGSQTTLEHH